MRIDEHPHVDRALELAAASGISVAVSNPCIELWFILHFQDQTAVIDRADAQHKSSDLLKFGKTPTTAALADLVGRYEVDVAVLGPGLPGEPRRVLSLGEAKWGDVMDVRHVERLRRARDLLSVKGYDTAATVLTCYSGAGFSDGLTSQAATDPRIMLVGLDRLYG